MPEFIDFFLEPAEGNLLSNLCGQFDCNLRLIEERLGVQIHYRGNRFRVSGKETELELVKAILLKLYQQADSDFTTEEVHLVLKEADARLITMEPDGNIIRARKISVKPRGKNQNIYVKSIRENDINFGVGPAGTGKTFLAVACAVEALEQERVHRLVLVRPAVEAGERLGFLPGDMAQKVDPYLRPIYDALYEMLGIDRVAKLIEKNIIEIAPLAYMRGRTLNNAFVILDEAQNTTKQQMKMFLTRIGFGSTAVVTGDITQIDLPSVEKNGLKDAVRLLKGVDGISFSEFTAADVVRHPLVQRIIEAYERNHS